MKEQGMWKKCVPILLSAPLVLGGCSLLPQEETGGHLVLVQAVDSVQYDLVEVVREDVQLVKELYCTYQQSQEETLSFGTAGRMVRYVHVKVGQNVKKGDILGELESDDLVEAIEQTRYIVEKNRLLLAQAEEMKAFDLEALKAQYDSGALTRAQYEERVGQTEENYEDTIAGYQDVLYIQELRLEKLEKELEGCQVYAGMDGMVSMVRGKMTENLLPAGAAAFTVIDTSQCVFSTNEMEYAKYFMPGQEVTLVNNNGTTYETRFLGADEAPDTEKLYFALIEPDTSIAVDTRAFASLVLDERKDVLALPLNAVYKAAGKSYVYCEDENGLKSVRYITTGLSGSKYVEIVEGLEEGEMVIRK